MFKELSNFLNDKRKGADNIVTHIVFDPNSSLRGSYNVNKTQISNQTIIPDPILA